MEKGVDIPIRTKVDDKDLGKLHGSLATLRATLKQAKNDLEKAAPDSAAFKRAAAEVQRLEAEIKKLEGAATAAAGRKGGTGMGMLQLGQAIEDAQYGLRGVMNNIPGVVMSLGLGAGAAGVLQVALVAVSQILDLVGKQSDDLKGKPLLGEMGFDERVMEQMRLFTEHLERQRDAVRERNEALRDSTGAVEVALKAEKAMIDFQRQMEDEDFVSTGDPVKDIAIKAERAQQRSREDAEMRARERALKLGSARGEQAAIDQNAAALDAEAKAQADKVAGLKQRAAVEEFLKFANDPNATIPKGAGGDGTLLGDGLSWAVKNVPGLKDLRAMFNSGESALVRKALDGAQIAKLQERLNGLPMLPGFEPSGDAKADEQKRRELLAQEVDKQRELEKARDAASREAASGRRKLGSLEAQSSGEEALDAARTAREQELIRRRADSDTEKQLAEEKRRRDEEAAKAAQDEAAKAALSQANAGLNKLAGAAGSAGDDAKISGLYAALNDGQGNQGGELKIVQDLLGKLGQDKAQNEALLNQAVRLMEQSQSDGTRMQQALSGVLNGVINNQRELASFLQGLQSQVNGITESLRR